MIELRVATVRSPLPPHPDSKMLDAYKTLIAQQYEAAFCMLARCVDRCPETGWNEPVASLKFCQAAFHAVFFTDLYLGPDVTALREQPFHRLHVSIFADYEELEPRRQQALYEKPFIQAYLAHCRDKAARVIAAETNESLAQRAGFDWLKFSRGELHVCNIRHLQHHAAQLSLRLRIDYDEQIPWVGSSWRIA